MTPACSVRCAGRRTRGASRASSSSSPRSTSSGRSSRSSSRSASRSTRAGRARPPRAGRFAGTRAIRTSPSSTTRRCTRRSLQSLRLAGIAVLVTVPLGVALAIGLTRWRGRGAGTSRGVSLATLVTPEIVMGTALLLVFVDAPDVHPARHGRAGDRPHHVLARLRRDHRARAAARDRAGVRGGGAGPRRVARSKRSGSRCCRCSFRRSSRAGSSSSRSRWTTSSSAPSCRPAPPPTPCRCGSTRRAAPRRRPR